MKGKNNNWPDFLIVGTARGGTTALHEHLGKHPDIFMPLQKEPCFFTFVHENPVFKDARHKYITREEDYFDLATERGERLWGESSTPYLYFHEKSIANIKQYVPDASHMKIVIVLRDPADRAYSQYMHNRRDLREPLSFEEAIEQEKQRMADNWHFDFFYLDKGFYYKQVKDYLDHFEHVHIVMFDDLEQKPVEVVNGVCKFLGLPDATALGEMKKRNQSGEMKVKWFKKIMTTRKNPILNALRKMLSKNARKQLRNFIKNILLRHNLKKVDMNPATRKKLVAMYQEDVINLSKLIHKDLSSWLR
jgi:hypothetical protein